MAQSVDRLGTLVWDTIADLSHKGVTTLDPDSAEGIELREAANAAMGSESEFERDLAFIVWAWLHGLASFDALKAASRAYGVGCGRAERDGAIAQRGGHHAG